MYKTLFSLFLSLCFAVIASGKDVDRVCNTVWVKSEENIKFSENEKKLLCGDPSSEAWSQIPFNQVKYELTVFLQNRGYLHPDFQVAQNHLVVDVGEKTLVSAVNVLGAPPELDVGKRRDFLWAPVTPARLDEFQKWIEMELGFLGYPCPTVLIRAEKETGKVSVVIEVGSKQTIEKISVNEWMNNLQVLIRYQAFKIGDVYNAKDLTLTEQRLQADNIVSTARLNPVCGQNGVEIMEDLYIGPPRTLKFGFGFNTEQVLLGRIDWRHDRLGENFSHAEMGLLTGFVNQRFSSEVKWYALSPRYYIFPNLTLEREKQTAYETVSIALTTLYGTAWDSAHRRWSWELGPALRYDKTVMGLGPANSRSLLLVLRTRSITHSFEYYAQEPREGSAFDLNVFFSNKDIVSNITAQKLELNSSSLWNYRNFSPPLLVLGLRSGIGTSVTNEPIENGNVPSLFRFYLGGSKDLRGFSLKELPASGTGALTSFFSSLEARFNVLPFGLQPFVFTDAGILGTKSLELQQPIYWSPGSGMRWSSPIGIFRGSIAHGFVSDKPAHWQLYLSYGEEF